MSDLRLKRIEIRNWMKVKKADIVFPEKGLVLVIGSNLAAEGKLQSVGCHPAGTRIISAAGQRVAVEDVRVGDMLMGPDSKPRRVVRLCRGFGLIYEVIPVKGESFFVNDEHILALKLTPGQYTVENGSVRTRRRSYRGKKPVFTEKFNEGLICTSVRSFLEWSARKRNACKLFRTGVEFQKKGLLIPPRILGLWLGDGIAEKPAITTCDAEIYEEWRRYGQQVGLTCVRYCANRAPTWALTTGSPNLNRVKGRYSGGCNLFLDRLKKLKVLGNKHIPNNYLTASRSQRYALLAGLIDTGGGATRGTSMDFTSSSQGLIRDFAFLARSLGFCVTVKRRVTRCQTGAVCNSFRAHLSGDLASIPVVLVRKKCNKRSQKKRHNVTGFSLRKVGFDFYFGFELNADKLYLLEDFTVTHNSGKTALGEALSRTLVGVAGRYSQLGYFSPDDEKPNTYIKLSTELLKKPLTVEMGFKCQELSRTGEGLRFQYGDAEPIQRVPIERTREELSKTLRVTPELANWTVFLDGDKLKFNKMSQEDSVGLLMTALAQPPWTEYHEAVAKKLQNANRQVVVSRQCLDSSKTWVTRCEGDLEDAKVDFAEAKVAYQRQMGQQAEKIAQIKKSISADNGAISAAKEAMESIKKKLKLLEEQTASINHQLEIDKQALRDLLALEDEKWTAATDERSALRSALEQARSVLSKMQRVPKVCPTCSKPWDKAHSAEELAKAQDKVEEAEEVFGKADKVVVRHSESRAQINTRIAAIDRQMREPGRAEDVRHLGELHAKNERMVSNLIAVNHERELQIERLRQGIDDSSVNNKQAVVAERERALESRRQEVQVAAENLAMDEEVMKIVQYWYRAYSPTGIPNMILSEAIPPLNRVAQRISSLMTGGTIAVTYSTTSTLATGESKPKLVIRVENKIGSKRMEGSSKGESGLTNLIIAENLSEIGQVSQRVGFRWYDEITGGQDSVVRRSIFAYLKEVAARLGILIFVVDHHVEAASYADHVLMAEKTIKEGTRYYWR